MEWKKGIPGVDGFYWIRERLTDNYPIVGEVLESAVLTKGIRVVFLTGVERCFETDAKNHEFKGPLKP